MPQPPRHPIVASPIPRPANVAVCLADDNAITIVRQLGRVIRSIDRSLPDIEHDTQVAFLPNFGRDREAWLGQNLSPELPRLHIFEGRVLQNDPSAKALYERLRFGHGIVPAAIRSTKATFFNYLSSRAIEAALGVRVEVTDHNDVPLLTASALGTQRPRDAVPGIDLNDHGYPVLKAMDLLANRVAPAMTADMLAERHAKADVSRWLYYIKLQLPRQFFD